MVRVIAEAGQCMNGDIWTAMDMAEAAAKAGAWGFKTQLLKPETIARTDAPKYWHDDFGTTDQRAAFTKAGLVGYDEWYKVKEHCDTLGIAFLATPFDLEAVEYLEDMQVGYYKIASGDITYRQLCERIAATGKPVFLSTGASTIDEIVSAVGWLGEDVTLLACTLSYPTPADAAHLARIETLRAFFPHKSIGYSDHTSLPETALGAAVLGAEVLEVHYTLDNDAPDVPDHQMAVNPERLAEYVRCAQLGAALRGSGLVEPVAEEQAARIGARRSICAARNLDRGHMLTRDDLVYLRPGDAIPPYFADSVIGMRLTSGRQAGEPI